MANEEVASVQQSSNSSQSTDAAAAASSTSGTQAKAATGEEINGASTFSSLSDFKDRAPKLYHSFMRGIAENMIGEMKRQNDRVKAAMKKIREKNQ